VTVSPNHILVISSTQDELEKVEKFLTEIFELHQLSKSCFNNVLLCVSEAVHNSITHGNKKNVHKKIEVHVNCKEQLLEVTVTDEGEGFKLESIPDPTETVNIKKESGRGIHIIKSLSQKIDFNEKGNSLQFQINCT